MKKFVLFFVVFYSVNLYASNCGYAPLIAIAALSGNLVSISRDCGRFPNSLEELKGESEYAMCARKHVKEITSDSWGNAYIYEFRAGMVVPFVKSLGADGKIGTKDDLSNYLDDGRLRDDYFVGCGPGLAFLIIPLGILIGALFGGYFLYRKVWKNA